MALGLGQTLPYQRLGSQVKALEKSFPSVYGDPAPSWSASSEGLFCPVVGHKTSGWGDKKPRFWEIPKI
jgi:hypothetical protein